MSKTLPTTGGNPTSDNNRRRDERRLNRVTGLRICTPGGRRRKKQIKIAETKVFKELIVAVAIELAKQDRAKRKANAEAARAAR